MHAAHAFEYGIIAFMHSKAATLADRGGDGARVQQPLMFYQVRARLRGTHYLAREDC